MMPKFFLAMTLCLLLSGCSTIVTKAESSQWGNPYSGLKSNGQYWVCMALTVLFVPPSGLIIIPIVLPVLAVDTVLSSVADTILYPVDRSLPWPQERIPNRCHI